jgi:hypothetical protein
MRHTTTLAWGLSALLFLPAVVTGHSLSTHQSRTVPPKHLRESHTTNNHPLSEQQVSKDAGSAHWWSRPSHPPVEAVHTITAVYWYEGLIEFEDGSRWSARLDSSATPRSLAYGERVTFRENRRWFAQSAFELVLLRTGETLPISPYQGPVLSSPYLRALVALDSVLGVVEASDGSLWELDIAHHAYGRVSSWAYNDVLMVGHHYDGWSASQFPALLYNCGADCWVPARRVR